MTTWLNRLSPSYWNVSVAIYNESLKRWEIPAQSIGTFATKTSYRKPHPKQVKITFSGPSHIFAKIMSFSKPPWPQNMSYGYDTYYRSKLVLPVVDSLNILDDFTSLVLQNDSDEILYVTSINISFDTTDFEPKLNWERVPIIDTTGKYLDRFYTGSKVVVHNEIPYVVATANLYYDWSEYKPPGAYNVSNLWGFALKKEYDTWKHILQTNYSGNYWVQNINNVLTIGRNFNICITKQGILYIGSYITSGDRKFLLSRNFNNGQLIDPDLPPLDMNDGTIQGEINYVGNELYHNEDSTGLYYGALVNICKDSLSTVFAAYIKGNGTTVSILKYGLLVSSESPYSNYKILEDLRGASYLYKSALLYINSNDDLCIIYTKGNGVDGDGYGLEELGSIKLRSGVWQAVEVIKSGTFYNLKTFMTPNDILHIVGGRSLPEGGDGDYHFWTDGTTWYEEKIYVPIDLMNISSMIVDINNRIHLFGNQFSTTLHLVQDGQYFKSYYSEYDKNETWFASNYGDVFYDIITGMVHLSNANYYGLFYAAAILDDHIDDPSLSSNSQSLSSLSSSADSKSSESSEYIFNPYVTYFDNSYWSSLIGSWDGLEWDDETSYFYATPLGGWEIGFRPYKIKLTLYSAVSQLITLEVQDTSFDALCAGSFVVNGLTTVEYNLAFGNDINLLYLIGDGSSFSIRNIQFKTEWTSESSQSSSSLSKDSKSSSQSSDQHLIWNEFLHDEEWDPSKGSWSEANNRWESEQVGLPGEYSQNIYIEAPETWIVHYRPTRMRLTVEIPGQTSALFSVYLSPVALTDEDFTFVSGVPLEFYLTFSGPETWEDIESLMLSQADNYPFYITNIEFFSEEISSVSSLSSLSSSADSKSYSFYSRSLSSISRSSPSFSDSSKSHRREIANEFEIGEDTNVSSASSESSVSSRSFDIGGWF